jgi:hypothetical protein
MDQFRSTPIPTIAEVAETGLKLTKPDKPSILSPNENDDFIFYTQRLK